MERTRELITRSQQGDLEARAKLVEENLPLVKSIAGRFRERGMDYEDLVQIGSLGLLKAIADFDLSYDVKFSTYAVPKIMGEIRQGLRKDSLLTVSRNLKQLASQAIATKDLLAQNLGRTPTISEIAAHLTVEREELVAALESVNPVKSLQKTIGTDDGPEFEEFLAVTPDQEHFLLKEALSKLEPFERRIILLRYFAEQSQTEVAKILGISQAQISRFEQRIVKQLRHEL